MKSKTAEAQVYENVVYSRFSSGQLSNQFDYDNSAIDGLTGPRVKNTIQIGFNTLFDASKIYQLPLLGVNFVTWCTIGGIHEARPALMSHTLRSNITLR